MTGPMLPEAVGLHAKRLSCEWSASTTRWLEGVSKHGERAYVTKLLKEQASAADSNAGTAGSSEGGDEEVVDAEFSEVDEDNKG